MAMDELNKPATILQAKLITLPVEAESAVVVVTSGCGLITIEQMQMAKSNQQKIPVRGIHEVCTNVPCQTLVRSFLEKPAGLHKYVCIPFDTSPPKYIVGHERKDGFKLTGAFNFVHPSELKYLHMQIERHNKG